MTSHYDAIIVGGRNAGSSLAIRLAKQNLKVFLIDRADFPSLPQVPSSPIIHVGTMRLLDELGFDEKEYTHPDGIITEYALNFVGHFQTLIQTELMKIDRNYGYGVDRNTFPDANARTSHTNKDTFGRSSERNTFTDSVDSDSCF